MAEIRFGRAMTGPEFMEWMKNQPAPELHACGCGCNEPISDHPAPIIMVEGKEWLKSCWKREQIAEHIEQHPIGSHIRKRRP